MRYLAACLLALVMGCRGGSDPQMDAGAAAAACPSWAVRVASPDGAFVRCYVAGINDTDACTPVACQAYADWCESSGPAGACSCAAACEARCRGDAWDEQTNVDEAAEAGVACVY